MPIAPCAAVGCGPPELDDEIAPIGDNSGWSSSPEEDACPPGPAEAVSGAAEL